MERIEQIERAARGLLNELKWLNTRLPLLTQQAAEDLREALGDPEPIQVPAPPEPVREPQEACEGFMWIGQSYEHCDGCSRPAWEHEGMLGNRSDSPFEDGMPKVTPWEGLMAEVRAKYLKGVKIEVHDADDGGRKIVYLK